MSEFGSEFRKIEMTEDHINCLKKWLACQDVTFPVNSKDRSTLLVCYSLFREMGGPNDELAQFIYDKKTNNRANDLVAEVGVLSGNYCVRILSSTSQEICISVPSLEELVSCRGQDIIISPAQIAAKIRSRSLTPIIVRDWLKRAIFSEFDPKMTSYRDQLWVLRNNEVLLYADLVANDKIIFQDMHDITAHIAGLNAQGYKFAGEVAARIAKKLHSYFGPSGRGNLTSHLIPFLIGIILDGLTQSMIYESASRRLAIDELLGSIDSLGIDPQSKLRLNRFPKGIDAINGLLQRKTEFSVTRLRTEIKLLVEECVSATRFGRDLS